MVCLASIWIFHAVSCDSALFWHSSAPGHRDRDRGHSHSSRSDCTLDNYTTAAGKRQKGGAIKRFYKWIRAKLGGHPYPLDKNESLSKVLQGVVRPQAGITRDATGSIKTLKLDRVTNEPRACLLFLQELRPRLDVVLDHYKVDL